MTRSADESRKRAQEYSDTKGSAPSQPAKAKSENEWRDAISDAIENAMRQGGFDNLAGRGKPLNLDRNPFTPEGYDLAWGILKNNDLTPGWIGARNELLGEIERWRVRVRAIAGHYARELAGAGADSRETLVARWQNQRQALQGEVEALNKRIRDLNLQQPVSHLEVFMLRLDEELGRAGLPEVLR